MRIRNLLALPLLGLSAALVAPSARALNLIEIADELGDVKHLSRINGEFYYYADDALFRVEPIYDAGTLVDFDVVTITTSASGIEAWGLTDASSITATNFYFATHQEWNGKGALWQSNGTIPGTTALTENVPRLTGVTHVGGGVVFFTNDDGDGNPAPTVNSTLWKTDGVIIEKVMEGISGQVRGLTAGGGAGNAFFTTYDGEDYQLWVTDGTDPGTENLTPPGGFPDDISYWYLTDVGGTLYFPVGDEGSFFPVYEPQSDFVLWRSDGTVGGTVEVTATAGLEIPINFRVQQELGADRHLWFSTFSNRDEEYDGEIFRLDTATDTLQLVKGGLDTVFSSDMAVSDDGSDLVYFAEYNEELDISTIWRSDGTPPGTFVFLDNLTEIHDLTCIDGVLYYASYRFEVGGWDDGAPKVGGLATVSLADPPLDGNWTGSLLGLDQSDVAFTSLAVGSALPLTPGQLGQVPGAEFTMKPAAWSFYRDLVKSVDAKNKQVKYKIAGKPSAEVPAGTVLAEWTKKFMLYDKKAVKGMAAADLPVLAPARINGLSVLAKEFSPNAFELNQPLLLAPPLIQTIESLSAPPVAGEIAIVRGRYFGAKPPKLYVEHEPKGDGVLKRKACKMVNKKITPLRFMTAAGKPNASCMVVRPDDPDIAPGFIGYSEVRYVYPDGIVNPTGWFILDNGIGLSTWQQP